MATCRNTRIQAPIPAPWVGVEVSASIPNQPDSASSGTRKTTSPSISDRSLSTRKRAKKIGICNSSGRQPLTGLTWCSW